MNRIDRYERHLRSLRRSDNTVRTYMTLLRCMDRELPNGLVGANRDELEEYLNAMRSSSAVILNRAVLRGFFAWACDPEEHDEWLDYNPTARLHRPRSPEPDPKPVASDQLAHILANAAEPYRTLFVLAAYAGLRCIEISRIERQHITDQALLVRRGKGDKLRRIPTHPILWRAVADLPAGRITELTPTQVSMNGNRRLGKLAPGTTMHALRHWFGTQAYNRSLDILAVKELMGHASVATTQVYVRVADGQRRAAVAALPDLT
jgi:integrase/recombinase XerC